jgi:hypothetical protein
VGAIELDEELRRTAEAAVAFAEDGEELTGIVPAEPGIGVRVYLCAYGTPEETTWLVLDADGSPVEDRSLVRDSVSIAGLCELAEEATGAASDGARIASPARLDELAAEAGPELVGTLKQAADTVDELLRDVERNYKRPLR